MTLFGGLGNYGTQASLIAVVLLAQIGAVATTYGLVTQRRTKARKHTAGLIVERNQQLVELHRVIGSLLFLESGEVDHEAVAKKVFRAAELKPIVRYRQAARHAFWQRLLQLSLSQPLLWAMAPVMLAAGTGLEYLVAEGHVDPEGRWLMIGRVTWVSSLGMSVLFLLLNLALMESSRRIRAFLGDDSGDEVLPQ